MGFFAFAGEGVDGGLDREDKQARGHINCYQEFIEKSGRVAVVFVEVSRPAAFVGAVDEGAVGAGGDAAEVVDLGFGEVMNFAKFVEAEAKIYVFDAEGEAFVEAGDFFEGVSPDHQGGRGELGGGGGFFGVEALAAVAAVGGGEEASPF